MAHLKFVVSLVVLAVWGFYLLYVWSVPAAVPAWAATASLRKVLMLGRDFAPTPFTLLFGLGFSAIAVVGVARLLTGRVDLQR